MKSKSDNLKTMNGSELIKKLADLREEIRSIRFKGEGAKSKNVKMASILRKQVARVLTHMNQAKTGQIK
jgi:ribosomal protein L29